MAAREDLPDWERLLAAERHLQALVPGAMTTRAIERSRALWNRSHVDLRSDEVLAQLLDRGELPAWRELYRLAAGDPELRRRMAAIVHRAPIAYPYFWLAALQSLGEPIDWSASVPREEPLV